MHDMRALFPTNENRYPIILVFALTQNTIFHDSFPLSLLPTKTVITITACCSLRDNFRGTVAVYDDYE